jgi:hypothetical protein
MMTKVFCYYWKDSATKTNEDYQIHSLINPSLCLRLFWDKCRQLPTFCHTQKALKLSCESSGLSIRFLRSLCHQQKSSQSRVDTALFICHGYGGKNPFRCWNHPRRGYVNRLRNFSHATRREKTLGWQTHKQTYTCKKIGNSSQAVRSFFAFRARRRLIAHKWKKDSDGMECINIKNVCEWNGWMWKSRVWKRLKMK